MAMISVILDSKISLLEIFRPRNIRLTSFHVQSAPPPPPGEQSLIKRTCVSDGGGKYGFALELRPVENCLGYGHSSTKFVKFR